MTDYYAVLEIKQDASPEEIRQQYRLLVHAWHPDKFPGSPLKTLAEAKMKIINEAYGALADPIMRAAYDRNYREYQNVLKDMDRNKRSESSRPTQNQASRNAYSRKDSTHAESKGLRTCPDCYKLQRIENIKCNRCGSSMNEDDTLKSSSHSNKNDSFKTCPHCYQLLHANETKCRRCHAAVG